ncbi:hypothetical protein TUMEXPCC7403_16575 [Tumidithrix helvetica PCC 7403]|uniref:adenylate/guanylate cyclase domain-containing protein n=1 Tax=Tumidithrix helvetica TaxID=3457545 RepID=UPI003C83CEAD
MKSIFLRNMAIALVVVSIFIFLVTKAQAIDERKHDLFALNFRQISALDTSLNENVFKIRYGLLTYYDPIITEFNQIKKLRSSLENLPGFVPPSEKQKIAAIMARLAEVQQQKETLIEQFKSKNAILKNSLAYLPVITTQLGTNLGSETQGDLFVNLINNLLKQVLLFNLGTNQDLVPQIDALIGLLLARQDQYAPKSFEDIKFLTTHAQIIVKYKPIVDTLTLQITSLPVPQMAEEAYGLFEQSYKNALDLSNFYRLLLFLFSLILTISISTYIILSLRSLNRGLKRAEASLRAEQAQSERLLLNILPEAIAMRLKQEPKAIADSFADVTVLFADIVNFTQMSSHILPLELVEMLNQIFSVFDRLSEQHGLEKIKTIGDAYMVVGGLPNPRADHAEAIADMALDMLRETSKFQSKDGTALDIRIGINSGSVVAGVIGTKKFIYDLWGDAVNVASRMESHGDVGKIQVTQATYMKLKGKYMLEERGEISIKGKGKMTTYWLTGKVESSLVKAESDR